MTALLVALLLSAEPEVDGVVTEVVAHGAFVAFGKNGLGFVHVDDLSWSGEKDPAKLVKKGQQVKIRVVRQSDPKRPSLILKRDEDDPWRSAGQRYRVGATHRAKVVSLPDGGLGLFLELEPWVEVLVHHSDLPPGKTPADYRLGQVVEVTLTAVDPPRKRISGALR